METSILHYVLSRSPLLKYAPDLRVSEDMQQFSLADSQKSIGEN